MYKLAPSILAADFTGLGTAINTVTEAGAHYLHCDIMDGHFVPNISFGPPLISSIKRGSKLIFDIHLMIMKPQRYIETFAKAGADIITVHYESFEKESTELQDCLQQIRDAGKMAGIAINPHTPLEPILPFVETADMLLVMSVEPGFGGQSLLPFSLGKAERLANFIQQKNLKTDIQMDGGIDLRNLKNVLNAGVNVVVAGTSVFGAADVNQAVKRFLETFASHEIRKRKQQKKL